MPVVHGDKPDVRPLLYTLVRDKGDAHTGTPILHVGKFSRGERALFKPFHFADGPANLLTNTAIDPIAKIPELKVCAARIEKA